MKQRKKTLIAALAMTAVLALTGCGAGGEKASESASGDSSENVTLTWATWALAEEALAPTYQAMVDTYMEEHPEVTIENVTYPYAQYLDQLIISASGGNAPDIAHIKQEWLPQLIEQWAIQDLSQIITVELKEDYYAGSIEGATVDGKLMASPWFTSPCALFYNKDLMAQAGIEEVPSTWSELMEAARAVSALGTDETGNKIYGYGLPNSNTEVGNGYNVFPHLWNHGGEYMNEDGTFDLMSEESLEAFAEVQSLYLDEITPNGSTLKDLRNLFAQGRLGFYYDLEMAGATFIEASPKGEVFAESFGAVPIPGQTDENGASYITQHYFVVFNTCDNLDAAASLLEHLSGETVLQILYDAGMGKMPARASVAEMDIYANPESEITKAFVNALPYARALPAGYIEFMDADKVLVDALSVLSVSDAPTEELIQGVQDELEELYGIE